MPAFDDCAAATSMNESVPDAMSDVETLTPEPDEPAATAERVAGERRRRQHQDQHHGERDHAQRPRRRARHGLGPGDARRRQPAHRRDRQQDRAGRDHPERARRQVERPPVRHQQEPEQRRPRAQHDAGRHARRTPVQRSSARFIRTPPAATASRPASPRRRSPSPSARSPCCTCRRRAPPSFRSIIGPDTRNASCAAGPNDVNDAATNASDSEQSDIRNASPIIASSDSTGRFATLRHDRLRHERLHRGRDRRSHHQEAAHEEEVAAQVRDEPRPSRLVRPGLDVHVVVAGARLQEVFLPGGADRPIPRRRRPGTPAPSVRAP